MAPPGQLNLAQRIDTYITDALYRLPSSDIHTYRLQLARPNFESALARRAEALPLPDNRKTRALARHAAARVRYNNRKETGVIATHGGRRGVRGQDRARDVDFIL